MATITTAATPFCTLICTHVHQPPSKLSFSSLPSSSFPHKLRQNSSCFAPFHRKLPLSTHATRKSTSSEIKTPQKFGDEDEEEDNIRRKLLQAGLWGMEGVYILWLFLLPFAPGDPVWAISSDTINSLVGLSLNFFFVLPLANAVGIHVLEAPVLHPMSEGLFNFVLGWTLMFAPLLFTDLKNDRYKGSLDVLWGFQMFLTNTFLIPYMAIRLNEADGGDYPRKPSQLVNVMIQGASTVGLIGGAVSLLSIFWALFGRTNGDFGSVTDRWDFLLSYLGSERLAYAFVWDIVLYMIFQPWLIGENMSNIQENRVAIVKYLRFVPVIGLVAYLVCLKREEELYVVKRSLNDLLRK